MVTLFKMYGSQFFCKTELVKGGSFGQSVSGSLCKDSLGIFRMSEMLRHNSLLGLIHNVHTLLTTHRFQRLHYSRAALLEQ
jgi:hypothetical protein